MNSKTSSSWLQILYAFGYGSFIGLAGGLIFAGGMLGGVSALARIIQYSGIIQ